MDKDSVIEDLKNQLSAAQYEVEQLRSRLMDMDLEQYDDFLEEEEDPRAGVSVSYDKFYLAQEIIDEHITDEMLKTAARQAAVQVETIRDVYVDGAMLGISTMREALEDLVSAQKKRKGQ